MSECGCQECQDYAPTPTRKLRKGARYHVVLHSSTLNGEFCAVFHGWDHDGLLDEFSKAYADTLWGNGVRLSGKGYECWEMRGWEE